MLFACSGPNAPAVIARSIEIGYIHALLMAGLLVASLLLSLMLGRHWLFPVVLIVLLTFHPAWTVSAVHGDCGYSKRSDSLLVTLVGISLLGWQCVRSVRSTRIVPGDLKPYGEE